MNRLARSRAGLPPLFLGCAVVMGAIPRAHAEGESLSVTLGPPGAVAAGAQWRVGTGPWLASGVVVPIYDANFYIVTFRDVPGWTTPPNIGVQIAPGQAATAAARYDEPAGCVAWGTDEFNLSQEPPDGSQLVDVACGLVSSHLLHADGTVSVWGDCLGGDCWTPVPNEGFKRLSVRWWNSAGLKLDDSIVAWGINNYGQHVVPPPNADFVALATGERHLLGLKLDGTIVSWGGNSSGQCNVPLPNAGFIDVASGRLHSVALRADGTVAVWGHNGFGQSSPPPEPGPFVSIAAGDYHTLARRMDGSLVVWGRNDDGQCNVPAPNVGFVAIAGGGGHSLAVRTDGSIAAFGRNGHTQCDVPEPNREYTTIAGGDRHSLALRRALGACCAPGETCELRSAITCAALGGVYHGDASACEPNPCAPAFCGGDADCDGAVSFFDIDAFVARLGCPDAGEACDDPCPWQNADVDQDGDVDFFDIDPFIARLGESCP